MSTKTTKSVTKTNIKTISNELTRLHKKRGEWEVGAYKRSNEQLYEILAGCHTLLVQLRGELKLRKKLNTAIQAAGFEVRSNTSLELKVVRAVFGAENNRTAAYTRVLQVAKKELPKGWTLPEWIEERGGVEEVRRTPKEGLSAADKAKQNRATAEKVLWNCNAITPRFKPNDSLQALEDGDYAFSVALVRNDADGQASIVFGSNKNALVKAVLTEAGKEIAENKANADVTSKQTKKGKKRDAVLNAEDSDFETTTAAAA